MELTDEALVAKARAGEADAFRALVERHGHRLFRLAYRMTERTGSATSASPCRRPQQSLTSYTGCRPSGCRRYNPDRDSQCPTW